MTRIIAGRAGGRRLAVPSAGTRPTSDRVREALFSSLDSDLVASGRSWSDIRVLDLFAGSGALGLEALSRGAASVLLVEVARPAVKVLRANVAAVDLAGATVLVGDARRLLATPGPGEPASLVLVDPPYAWSADDLRELLRNGADAGWIAAGADVVVERPARDVDSPLPDEWEMWRRRDYGDTALWYGHVTTSDRRDEEDA
ncbi:MAG: 16S rRNA (guanine(966)-N(2))-methyltransferase RsmD [Actinomycetales bacterium]|nr:16S rRNA (guanine(966)-N(2))-methyltransferase RsmD [Actinomycetales bacterium]